MPRQYFTKFAQWALLALALWVGVRFLLPILGPFLLALGLALAAEGGVRFLHARLRLPRAAASALAVSGVFALLLTVTVLVLASLVRQVPRLSALLPDIETAVTTGRQLLQSRLLQLADRLPDTIGAVARPWVQGLFSSRSSLLQGAMDQVPKMVTGLAGRLSNGLFGLVTALIAGFMVSARLPQLKALLPAALREKGRDICRTLGRGLGGWLTAQCKLAAVTFGILLAGFWLLGIPNGAVWALLVALVDAFPILGVGTVLLPWALVCLLQEKLVLGVGLLALYAVTWLTRSLLEPRLLAKELDLDPLVTLLAIYAGYRLGGIGMMLLAPFLAMAATQLWRAWK